MRHKVVLYNPGTDFCTMPPGLIANASALDRERYDVRIIDGRIEADPVKAMINESRDALCLGIGLLRGAQSATSCVSAVHRQLRAVSRLLNERDIYAFPLDKKLVETLRPAPKLS